MKRFSILLAAAALFAAVTGCQKEPAGNEELAKAYAQLTFSFESNSTKAPDVDGTDDKEAGIQAEYQVKSATLYFVNDESEVANISEFTGNFSENVDPTTGEVHYTHVVEKLAIGTYKIYATVNHKLSNITVGATEAALQTAIVTETELIGTNVPSTGLPMSSRNVDAVYNANATAAGLYTTAEVTSANTKDNPLHINLSIERSVAKISYKVNNESNTYQIYPNKATSGTKIADVTLIAAAVLNQTKVWNAYRRVCTYDLNTVTPAGFGKIGAGYLYDPNIGNKNQSTAGNAGDLVYDGTEVNLPTSEDGIQVLAYAYENAVHKSMQLAGYVTTIRFVGTITPSANNYYTLDGSGNLVNTTAFVAGSDLYYYDNKFYGSLEALNKEAQLGVSSSNFKDFNVKFYDDAKCYYDYYIKHFDNEDYPDMGVMEYAIVRNNSYVVTVTGIISPGNDDATDVAPETPVEQQETYFQVKLTIKPWVVRSQNATLG